MRKLILLTIINIFCWWMLVEVLIAKRRFPDETNWILAVKKLRLQNRLLLLLAFALFFGVLFWIAVELKFLGVYEVFGVLGYLVALIGLVMTGRYKWPRFRKS
ncbi:MAG: hypothetical protein ACRCYY_03030 [Trueperaceae bacterium]